MAQGYYDEDFAPWIAGIRNLGAMITRQPALRAQAQQQAMQDELTGARIGTERAQAGKYDAETANFVRKGQLVTALEQHGAQAQADLAAGKTDTPSVRAFVAASSALTGLNGDDIAANMKKGLGTMLARQGDVRGAAGVEDPNKLVKTEADNASREKIAENRAFNVSPGGAVYQGGKVVYERPSAANEEYETETTVYPATEGTPGTPAQPAKFGWFGRKVADAVPETPGTPGTPERRVTTRRKLGGAVASQPAVEQGTDMDEDGQEEMLPDSQPAAPAPETVAGTPKRPDDASVQALLKEADRAIQAGADRKAVIARLKEKYGITVKESQAVAGN